MVSLFWLTGAARCRRTRKNRESSSSHYRETAPASGGDRSIHTLVTILLSVIRSDSDPNKMIEFNMGQLEGLERTRNNTRVEWAEFRRKLPWERYEKSIFQVFWMSRKVTSSQNTLEMVPGNPSCLQSDPRWSLDAPWVLPKQNENDTTSENGKWKPGNHEICKDAIGQT